MTTGAIVLAAGFSRRFGGIKLNAVLPDGNTVLQRTSQLLTKQFSELRVVTRPALIAAGVFEGTTFSDSQIVLCDDAELGMGHSLACAARSLPPDWDACLVCLGDMPFINEHSLQQICATARPDGITIPVFAGQRGHPVCFGRDFFAELAQSRGDVGARDVLKAHPDQITLLQVDDPGIVQDIDVPSDLNAC